jgi:hypothetical protein
LLCSAWGLAKHGLLGCNVDAQPKLMLPVDTDSGDTYSHNPFLVAGLHGRHVTQVQPAPPMHHPVHHNTHHDDVYAGSEYETYNRVGWRIAGGVRELSQPGAGPWWRRLRVGVRAVRAARGGRRACAFGVGLGRELLAHARARHCSWWRSARHAGTHITYTSRPHRSRVRWRHAGGESMVFCP